MKLSKQVRTLEQHADELAALCGEVLATIRVNWDRGTLSVLPTPEKVEQAGEMSETFRELLEMYEARLRDLKANTGADRP